MCIAFGIQYFSEKEENILHSYDFTTPYMKAGLGHTDVHTVVQKTKLDNKANLKCLFTINLIILMHILLTCMCMLFLFILVVRIL